MTESRNFFAPNELTTCSLADYDSDAFGPLFAISDEGSAAKAIVDAAYASAKARAFSQIDPYKLGVVLDGERMTSAGEVPVGLVEYKALSSSAAGRLLLTTNVGVRVNARLTQQLPEVLVTANSLVEPQWIESTISIFQAFLNTPDGRPRPLTVYLLFEPNGPIDSLQEILKKLDEARMQGKIGPANVHRFAVLTVFENEISAEEQIAWIERLMAVASEGGVKEVAIDGELLEASRKRLGIQSLLNVVSVENLRRLLGTAKKLSVQLRYRYQIDVDSAARTIWTGLSTARANGCAAGKYGLVPLTLEEQAVAMELLTQWTAGWTAIPAFYVDTPLVTATDVFDVNRCEEAAKLWLKTARGAGVTLVLFDSPDRVTPRKLVRSTGNEQDNGVLTILQIERIAAYAKDLGVSILWSGGITSRQAFDLAKSKVFGIFSTSSTAAKIAVTAQFESDPRLAAENEPTEFGVRRMHAVIQGGFLSTVLGESDRELATSIEALTGRLLSAENDARQSANALSKLDIELQRGWRSLTAASPHNVRTDEARDIGFPVPPDSVRVFIGRKVSSISHGPFVRSLGSVFMPTTVQMQRLYGLTAYLPAVLPETKGDALPDEVALVFYRTQRAYHEAKRCVGGRAYSELHNLVFDMPASRSSFPRLFDGIVETGESYYLFERSVDWQCGTTRIYVGRRRAAVSPKDFLASISRTASKMKKAPGEIDAAIFHAQDDFFVWWDHVAQFCEEILELGEYADEVYVSASRRLSVPHNLTEPFEGVSVDGKGDFLNFTFLRN
jgi:hypothetical protein